jgi:hypothetical protein
MKSKLIIILLFILIGVSYSDSVEDRWPSRLDAIQVMKVLSPGYMTPYRNYRVYIDDPYKYPSKSVMINIARYFLPSDMSDDDIYSKVQLVETKIKDQMVSYLMYMNKTIDGFNVSFDQDRAYNIFISSIDYDSNYRGYIVWGGINAGIIFKDGYQSEQREWVVLHEMMHGFFDEIHDNDGVPVRPTDIGPLTTENSIVIYDESSTFKAPGSTDDDYDLLYLGEFDWSIAQTKSNLTNPVGKLIEFDVDGKAGRRGSPGPMKWFSKITVGPSSGSLPDFITTWHSNFLLLNSLTDDDLLGFFPFWNSDTRRVWYDMWNFDEATISLYPGKTLFRYRSDYMSGPSFDPMNEDTPIYIYVKHIKYVDVKLYGKDRTLDLFDVNTARIEVGPELIGVIKGFDDSDDFIRFPDDSRIIPQYTCSQNQDNDTVISWKSYDMNRNLLSSTVTIVGVNHCGITVCGGTDDEFGSCPSLPTKSTLTDATALCTMILPIITIGLICFAPCCFCILLGIFVLCIGFLLASFIAIILPLVAILNILIILIVFGIYIPGIAFIKDWYYYDKAQNNNVELGTIDESILETV